jgi:hypothetical protein
MHNLRKYDGGGANEAVQFANNGVCYGGRKHGVTCTRKRDRDPDREIERHNRRLRVYKEASGFGPSPLRKRLVLFLCRARRRLDGRGGDVDPGRTEVGTRRRGNVLGGAREGVGHPAIGPEHCSLSSLHPVFGSQATLSCHMMGREIGPYIQSLGHE